MAMSHEKTNEWAATKLAIPGPPSVVGPNDAATSGKVLQYWAAGRTMKRRFADQMRPMRIRRTSSPRQPRSSEVVIGGPRRGAGPMKASPMREPDRRRPTRVVRRSRARRPCVDPGVDSALEVPERQRPLLEDAIVESPHVEPFSERRLGEGAQLADLALADLVGER